MFLNIQKIPRRDAQMAALGGRVQTVISRSESGYGMGRSRQASTTLNMAVLAPMPIARVSTVMAVDPGLLRNNLAA